MAEHFYAVTWDQLHRDARALAWRLVGQGPFQGVVAITRGGLIPAAIIARELECRLVETSPSLTYEGEGAGTRGEPQVIKAPAAAGDGTGFLIVDDLVDTGATARVVRALLPRAHFACIYAKPAGPPGGGQLRHRSVAGHLDPVPLGHRHRAEIRRADRARPHPGRGLKDGTIPSGRLLL